MTLKVLQLTLSENILHPENCGGVAFFFSIHQPEQKTTCDAWILLAAATVLYAVQKDGLYRA